MNKYLTLLILSISLTYYPVSSFSTSTPTQPSTSISTTNSAAIFEKLKWGGSTPDFDVLRKTQEYVKSFEGGSPPVEEWYDKDYVLRGAVIGPLTRKDLTQTQGGFGLLSAFPDIKLYNFGFTVDPENPYRCFFFSRWRATHTGPLKVGPQTVEATGNVFEPPVWVNTVFWTPEGKIVYEQVGSTVDRLEGNTGGKAAVFGLLHTAGVKLSGTPGNLSFRIAQRLGNVLGFGRSWSKEEDIPSWWTSKSRGADPSD